MITRTIKATVVNAMVCDTAKGEVYTTPVKVNGTFKTFEKGGDCWKAINELPTWKNSEIVVKVDFVEVIEKLYGMSEEMFMKYGKELPPRKASEESSEE